MINTDEIININNKVVHFEEIFNKKVDAPFEKYTYLNNKTLLITGGAGTIGGALIKHLLSQDIKQIIAIDHSEYGIFKLGLNFRQAIEDKKLFLFLGDIRNEKTIDKIFSSFPIQIIYHAAAYKHINILENNGDESVTVNIDATLKILKKAQKSNSEQFIFISTDKAVNPINKMGISKRIAELNLINEALIKNHNLNIKIIRFGNVFNSNGSIFNIFKFQIENKLPITITHKNMKRYFISKSKAIKGLITLSNPQYLSGIYLLNMGPSYKIDELLNRLLQKLNLNYSDKILYNNSILNKFEKLDEELHFTFEQQEDISSFLKKINFNSYNLKKIELEIQKYSQLLKI